MPNRKIPLALPEILWRDSLKIFMASRTGWLTQAGPEVKKMEDSIKSFALPNGNNAFDVTTTSNGSTALELALLSFGVGPGDEVVMPDFCYVAVANAIIHCGATPVVVDCESTSWLMNSELVLNAVTKRTKAVIAVDNYGFLADVEKLRQVVPEAIPIILDAAESFPHDLLSRRLSYVNLCTGSFYANKIVTTGEGGFVAGDVEKIRIIRSLKNQGLDAVGSFNHVRTGYNYRITNLAAALFNSQWRRKEVILKRREAVFDFYVQELNLLGNSVVASNAKAVPWLFTIQLNVLREKRDLIRRQLAVQGVETRPGFPQVSQLSFLKNQIREAGTSDFGRKYSEGIISLPTYPTLQRESIEYVVKSLKMSMK